MARHRCTATDGRVGWYGVRMTRPMLADAFAHHVWATQTLLDACLRPDPGAAPGGGAGDVRLDHRHDAPPRRRRPVVPARADRRGPARHRRGARRRRWTSPRCAASIDADGPAWADFLARDLDPDETVIRQRDDGSESHAPRGIRVAQVIHHGTDHRSQICTALTSLGITPPEIDAWDFARAEGRLSETEPTAADGLSAISRRRARAADRITASNIAGVSLPVNVFCWLGWYEPEEHVRPDGAPSRRARTAACAVHGPVTQGRQRPQAGVPAERTERRR